MTFTTSAGPEPGGGSDDGVGSAARFRYPDGVATDSSGNVYVADTFNHTIRKISPGGAVMTLAGLAGVAGSVDGTGAAARFQHPRGVATDSSGNVYVADTSNNTIRKITPTGTVTTLAGLAGSAGSTDGTGSAARFRRPEGIAAHNGGTLYVADTGNHTVRTITATGTVTTLAGLSGVTGSADGAGSLGRFNDPQAVAIDNSGNIHVADSNNNTIRKITSSGAVTTLAGLAGVFGSDDGTGTAARFARPRGVAVDSDGNVYVGDTNNATIRKISPAGAVTTLAGSPENFGSADGTGSAAQFGGPEGVAVDGNGNVYVAEASGNQTIRRITPVGEVTTFSGLTPARGSVDGTGSAARFDSPRGVTADSSGNIYVADWGNNMVRKIDPAGVVTTSASTDLDLPDGIAVDSSGDVYVASTFHTIQKITSGGTVATLAGAAFSSGSADGTGSDARFNRPLGVAIDGSGNVFVADSGNHTIRKITTAGVVTTFAGAAGSSGSTDGMGSIARFNRPSALVIDTDGNLYVADTSNHTIRKITPDAAVTTFAGLPAMSGSANGMGSSARFASPSGVAIDADGNVYVADSSNHAIRKIDPAGLVATLAGLAGTSGSADGTASAARFDFPTGLTVDGSGNVFVTDRDNHRIRVGRSALADVATIDAGTGPAFVTRQLNTTPQTAITWQWNVVRRPVNAAASLSSMTVRNPTFTPDAPGLFTFRLTAIGASASSITTVNLVVAEGNEVLAAPAAFSATATGTTAVTLAWAGVGGATGYEIFRSAGNSDYTSLATVTTTTASDPGLSADTTYLYKVRALAGGEPSTFSAIDVATTIVFTDDPVTSGGVVKALHVTQLRVAVDAMRAAKALGPASHTNAVAAGTPIRSADIAELRSALDAARTAIGLMTLTYTNTPIVGGTTIKAVHIQELRAAVK